MSFKRYGTAIKAVSYHDTTSLSPPNAIPWQMQFSLTPGPTRPAHLGDPAPERHRYLPFGGLDDGGASGSLKADCKWVSRTAFHPQIALLMSDLALTE